MRYMTGNIWQLADELEAWLVVPTNTDVRQDRKAVMGAGMAKEAVSRYPGLAENLAAHITRFDSRIYVQRPIICLPTKHNWRKLSKIEFVEQGCYELLDLSRILSSVGNKHLILLPQLGCGLGGLNWERQVRPLVDSILEGDRFILVTQ